MVFNFLGRDFFNALSEKDVDGFYMQLVKYLGGFAVGIPVFVFKGYYQVRNDTTKNMINSFRDMP